MSLFPAYADTTNNSKEEETTTTSNTSVWLDNSSFQADQTQLKELIGITTSEPVVEIHSSSTSTSNTTTTSSDSESLESKKQKKVKHGRKKERRKSKLFRIVQTEPKETLEFDGKEDYYVDKNPVYSYKSISTLHRPARPRYQKNFKCRLGSDSIVYALCTVGNTKSVKRYYRELKSLKALDLETPNQALDENEYTLRLGNLNRKVMEAPAELQNWLGLIQLQEQNPYKWSRLLLAEKKIEIVKRAMVYHPRHDTLYRIFVDTISDTYPSFEVSKLLDGLLNKDSYSYTLWTAQIMTTQGSMARCIVPDVLRIYERCMQKMHHYQKQPSTSDQFDTDVIMLRLFNNCALFLRQAGLYEQFFALIKLALELNVSIEQFNCFTPNEEDQRTLIEYEELILQSGLPMNEIWLRVEKLRQCFNFLPCPVNNQCSDPQRIVFNEDVCHYIYPLKNMDNSFYLMLLILRLLKVPFVQCDRLAAKFSVRVDAIGDSDSVEEALSVGVRFHYATYQTQHQQESFFGSLYELAREMAVPPTFLSSSIGYEIYVKCISELLQSASSAYAGIDERKRIIFLLLLCRFERLRLVLEKAAKKLTPEFIKSGRSRFKILLKQTANRNCLILYTELALYELETLEHDASLDSVKNTFESIISNVNEAFAYDLANTYVNYAEVLIGRGLHEEAIQTLATYVLKMDIKQKKDISTARKLSALKQISEKLDGIIAVERSVEIMVLEQYLLPDQTVTLLKIRIFLQFLIGQKLEALSYLDKLITMFNETNDRHQFLRERIYEVYITIAQLPSSNCIVSNAALSSRLFEAIKEFPRNLYFLQNCGMLMLPWYRIRRAMLGDEPNIMSLTFLIAAARFRFLNLLVETTSLNTLMPTIVPNECDQQHNQSTVRNRILNVFQHLTSTSSESENRPNAGQKALRRNALFWRLYLRCISDQNTAFETSKKCLLTALDDCPWSKALYMDGATYVPQELSHLQDLMIEKQLRVYALPEELEILRER